MNSREYIPSYGPDEEAIKHGINWLINDDKEILVLYVPTLRQVEGGTVLTNLLGKDIAKRFRDDGFLQTDGKKINLITNKKLPYLKKPTRVLALWADSKSLEKIENQYEPSNLLVVTWNSKHDIEEWKKKNSPNQFQGYNPPLPPEGDF